MNARLLDTERVGQGCVLARPAFERVAVHTLTADTLDKLPIPSRIGATRVEGIDLNRARMRSSLAAVLVLAAAPRGFTVADYAEKVHSMTGQTAAYSTRHAAHDLRKRRGK